MRDFPAKTVWRKSYRSTATGNECVELAAMAGFVGVRDSADPDGLELKFASSAWREFMIRVKNGQGGFTKDGMTADE